MSKLVEAAIAHQRETGNIDEALAIATGAIPAPAPQRKPVNTPVNETGGGPATSQTQTWFCPDENAVNQLQLMVMNKLGIKGTCAEYTNGSQGGYTCTYSGSFGGHDIASLASRLGGVYPITNSHQPGDD